MRSLPYAEGDLFCVPVGTGGWLLGLIARVAPGGKILVVYVFRELLTSVPSEATIPSGDAVLLKARTGDLGLVKRSWPVVRRKGEWDRTRWPLPVFGRVQLLGEAAWRVEYQDDNPNSTPRETLVTLAEAKRLPDDALYGHIALESSLAHKLGVTPAPPKADSPTAFHVVRCTSPSSARDVALLAQGRGLLVETRVMDRGWIVEVAQPLPASRRAIQQMEDDLTTIAAACDAEYTGFERGK